MDVEKTMQFILEQQAECAVMHAEHKTAIKSIERLLQKVVEFQVQHSIDVEKHEQALDDLLVMHRLNAKEIKETSKEVKEVARVLKEFIKALRGSSGNGSSRKN